MSIDISIKSTGQLVDETITNAFKTHSILVVGGQVSELEARYKMLHQALLKRLGPVADLIHDLAIVSMATWNAQERLMNEKEDSIAAAYGRNAQRYNAQRSKIIREIDRLLGESDITITTKTYG